MTIYTAILLMFISLVHAAPLSPIQKSPEDHIFIHYIKPLNGILHSKLIDEEKRIIALENELKKIAKASPDLQIDYYISPTGNPPDESSENPIIIVMCQNSTISKESRSQYTETNSEKLNALFANLKKEAAIGKLATAERMYETFEATKVYYKVECPREKKNFRLDLISSKKKPHLQEKLNAQVASDIQGNPKLKNLESETSFDKVKASIEDMNPGSAVLLYVLNYANSLTDISNELKQLKGIAKERRLALTLLTTTCSRSESKKHNIFKKTLLRFHPTPVQELKNNNVDRLIFCPEPSKKPIVLLVTQGDILKAHPSLKKQYDNVDRILTENESKIELKKFKNLSEVNTEIKNIENNRKIFVHYVIIEGAEKSLKKIPDEQKKNMLTTTMSCSNKASGWKDFKDLLNQFISNNNFKNLREISTRKIDCSTPSSRFIANKSDDSWNIYTLAKLSYSDYSLNTAELKDTTIGYEFLDIELEMGWAKKTCYFNLKGKIPTWKIGGEENVDIYNLWVSGEMSLSCLPAKIFPKWSFIQARWDRLNFDSHLIGLNDYTEDTRTLMFKGKHVIPIPWPPDSQVVLSGAGGIGYSKAEQDKEQDKKSVAIININAEWVYKKSDRYKMIAKLSYERFEFKDKQTEIGSSKLSTVWVSFGGMMTW